MARFCPLFSGSSGNCTYVGTPEGGILIDAGVSAKRIETACWDRGIGMDSIRGIFVTHEHSDHTAGLRVLQKRFGIPIFASRGTCAGLIEGGALPVDADCRVMESAVELAGLQVLSFRTPHDSRESTGYRVSTSDGRTLAVATDMGHMTDQVRAALYGCDLILIESNHDIRMLENGPYPYVLKRRILASTGHLSNDACSLELPELVRRGTTRLFLAHLSKENNSPDLAYVTAQSALTEAGMRAEVDFVLRVAPRTDLEPVMVF
mgnify:FL=1